MPTIAKLGREQFVSWLAGDADFAAQHLDDVDQLAAKLGRNELFLIWPTDVTAPSSVDNPVVIVGDRESDDFFAWASTYVSSYQPFSAFFRVIEIGDLGRFEAGAIGQSAIPLYRLEELVGVVIAEAAMQIGKTAKSLNDIPVSAALSTLSYALLNGLCAGMHPSELANIAQSWSKVRSVTGSGAPSVSSEQIMSFWLLIATELSDSLIMGSGWLGQLRAVIRSQLTGDDTSTTIGWRTITSELPELAELTSNFSGSREDQLRRINRISEILRSSRESPILSDAICGYFLARLSNGSSDYLPVFTSYAGDFPLSPLWATFFSSTLPGYDYVTGGQNLGRRIVRSLLERRSFFDPPTTDISLRELEVLSRAGRLKFRTNSSVMSVEVVPFVGARFRNQPAERPDDRTGSSEVELLRIRRNLDDLARSLDALISPRSPSLFDRPMSKKAARTPRK